MALGRPADAAGVLKRLQGAQSLSGFAAYNLGIALLQEGRQQDAIAQLDRAGQLSLNDAGPLAIRDKSNMVLGKLMLESTDFRARAVVLRPRAPRRSVLEPGAAQRGLGRRLGAELRARSGAVEHSREARSDRQRCAGSVARAAVCVQPVERSRSRCGAVQRRAEVLRRRARQGRRLDREHRGWQIPQGAGARGDPAGQRLGHPVAHAARRARDLLSDAADGVARLPDGAAELPGSRRAAPEDVGMAEEPRCVRGHDSPPPRKLRAASAGRRRAVSRARRADPSAHGATQSLAAAAPAAAHRAAAGTAGDGG